MNFEREIPSPKVVEKSYTHERVNSSSSNNNVGME